jgi:hypothetical protein
LEILKMDKLDTFTRRPSTKVLQAVSAIAMILCLGVPVAIAGATNRGDNTSAATGEKSSTTTTPTDANVRNDNIRKGTNNSKSNGSSRSDASGRNTAGPSSGSGSSDSGSIRVGPPGESSRGNGTGTGDSNIK